MVAVPELASGSRFKASIRPDENRANLWTWRPIRPVLGNGLVHYLNRLFHHLAWISFYRSWHFLCSLTIHSVGPTTFIIIAITIIANNIRIINNIRITARVSKKHHTWLSPFSLALNCHQTAPP